VVTSSGRVVAVTGQMTEGSASSGAAFLSAGVVCRSAYLGHLACTAGAYICYGQFAAPVQKWPKIAPKSPKLAKKNRQTSSTGQLFLPHQQ
jgi:hypothetical protein